MMIDAFDELEVDAATLAAELAAQRPMDWFEVDAEIVFFRRFGLRDRAIAHRLGISTATVRAHDKARAARWAAREAAPSHRGVSSASGRHEPAGALGRGRKAQGGEWRSDARPRPNRGDPYGDRQAA